MPVPSASTIERHLLALDHEGFVDFVADLWTACGWDVATDGAVLAASKQGEVKRLLVVPPYRLAPRFRRTPDSDGPIDAVVSPLAGAERSDLPRGTPAASVVGVEGIRERLLYAVDDEARERLLATHLGIGTDDDTSAAGASPIPAIRVPRSGRASVAGVGLLLVLSGLAIVLVATGVPLGDSSSGTANASEGPSTGGYTTASVGVYDARPTCERGPGEVVAISVNATRGSSLSRGLVVMGDFWNPSHVRAMPSGAWHEMMTTEAHLAFYDAESVAIGEPRVEGDEATVAVTATIDGADREYAFELGRGDRTIGEGCWMIESFGPA